jgi:hypothetical protein
MDAVEKIVLLLNGWTPEKIEEFAKTTNGTKRSELAFKLRRSLR